MQVIRPVPVGAAAFQLSPALQSGLKAIGSELKVASEEVLFVQGDECKGAYLLSAGSARIYMRDDRGIMITCRDLGPGCILGLPATLCVQPYQFSAETKEECTFSLIPADVFQEFLRTYPTLCMEVVQLMSQELALMNRKRTDPSKCEHAECSLRPTCSQVAN